MQISTLPQIAPEHKPVMFSRLESRESIYQSHTHIAVEYFDSGDTVILSGTNTSLYMESTYTAEGVMLNSGSLFPEDTGVLSPPPKQEIQDAMMFSDAHRQYMEMIRERVAFLLRETAEKSEEYQQILLQDGHVDRNEESTAGVVNVADSQNILYVLQTTDIVNLSVDTSAFSPENIANRIVQFALAFYTGGDREEYVAMIREAIMKGFQDAQAAFGGFLPEVCYQTLDLVNQAFNDFAAGSFQ